MSTVGNQGHGAWDMGQKTSNAFDPGPCPLPLDSASPDLTTAYNHYTASLLAGDRAACRTIVEQLLRDNCPIKILYQDIFQMSLYHVGELWEQNIISVAREHVATAITESLLALVFPVICATPKTGKKVVVACTAHELHQLGARMVADFLEMNGWDSQFLGSNTPPESVVHFLHEQKPDLLCLSLSVQMNLNHLIETIAKVRNSFSELPIAVGGQAFHWGGTEQVARHHNVHYVASLDQLEQMIQS